MLEIIIEDDPFRPLWDSSHSDYKLRNKQHFYELLKDRLIAENHRIESTDQLHYQFKNLHSSYRRTAERHRTGVAKSDTSAGKFFVQFQALYLKMSKEPRRAYIRSNPIENNSSQSIRDDGEIEDISDHQPSQLSSLEDILESIKDEAQWQELEDSPGPSSARSNSRISENNSASIPSTSAGHAPFSLEDLQKIEQIQSVETQNARKRKQVTPPLELIDWDLSESSNSSKKPRTLTDDMTQTLANICREIEKTKPGATNPINKALGLLITQATNILYG
ncbi:hypothetical protein WR25_23932 [Diploscapter pachys]|uniref:MADF domain-containing protein n=1 Tax=Diploscapter pachys TaxID=2018661 RepID=A0A2A2J9V1_9BILA|nr:hypothetical protein WR25_23932 [Diploscapter pachys]